MTWKWSKVSLIMQINQDCVFYCLVLIFSTWNSILNGGSGKGKVDCFWRSGYIHLVDCCPLWTEVQQPPIKGHHSSLCDYLAIATLGTLSNQSLNVVETIHKDVVDEFTAHLNNRNHSIQFMVELQGDDKDGNQHLPVLDLDIQRSDDGSSKFKIYNKSTHADQYLNFNSHHPLHQLLEVVRTLFDRANSLITTEEDILTEINNIKAALKLCDYLD